MEPSCLVSCQLLIISRCYSTSTYTNLNEVDGFSGLVSINFVLTTPRGDTSQLLATGTTEDMPLDWVAFS